MKTNLFKRKKGRLDSSLFLRTFSLLALLVVGIGVSWGQDATFNMGQMVAEMTENGCKLTFAGGGSQDVNTTTGVTTLSTKTENEVKTSASMTFTGKQIRYIKITFADNDNTYNLKWGGSWTEEINANNVVSGTGTLVLVSNSGPSNFKIINDIDKGTESTPIKKVEVYYWNDGYTATGNQTEANATKAIPNTITWENNTVDLSKINVVGAYASFGTNGKGAMLKNSEANYLSIKFEEPADLSGISYFRIDGENVDKNGTKKVFDLARFICDNGNGGTVNVDKYNNPANVSFTATDETTLAQKEKLKKVNEIRLYNNDFEGSFSINSIKFIYEYTLTWVKNDIPAGCDAWYTIGSNATLYREESKKIEAGTKVTFHGTDTGDDHKMILGWLNPVPEGPYWGYGATKEITVSSDFSVKPDFQPCFHVFAKADNGATATVNTSGKHFQSVDNLTFETTVPDGYTFLGWDDGNGIKGTENPWNYGKYTSQGGTTDLTLTAKFAAPAPTILKIDKPLCNLHKNSDGTTHSGDNFLNIQNLNANAGMTIAKDLSTGVTVTPRDNGSYASFVFNEACNLTDLVGWTFDNESGAQAKVTGVQFRTESAEIRTYNNNAGNRTSIDDNLKKELKNVKEIRLFFSGECSFKWFNLKINHRETVNPTLIAPTKEEMVVYAGEPIVLKNTSGYWREWNSDYTSLVTYTITDNEFNKEYTLNWPSNDYYFEVKDALWCGLGEMHESEVVRVHAKVLDKAVESYNLNNFPDEGGNVTKVEKNGNPVTDVTVTTTGSSNNALTLYSGLNGVNGTGIRVDSKGVEYRLIVNTTDGQFIAHVPASTDFKTQHFTWSQFIKKWGTAPMTDADVAKVTDILIAGNDVDHAEENFTLRHLWIDNIADYEHTYVCYGEEDASFNGGTSQYEFTQNGGNAGFTLSGGGSRDANNCLNLQNNKTLTLTPSTGCNYNNKIRIIFDGTTDYNLTINGNNVTGRAAYYEFDAVNGNIEVKNNGSDLPVSKILYSLSVVFIDQSKKITSSNETRDYWLYVPENVLNGTQKNVPVLFSLHGTNNDYNQWDGGVQDYRELAAQQNFIVVNPRGKQRDFNIFPATNVRGWDSDGTYNKDVKFFEDIIDELARTYSINQERIYITGFSNGGMMTYQTAFTSKRFAGFAAVGGYPLNEFHLQHYGNGEWQGSHPVPFMHIHGSNDGTVTPELVNTIVDNMVYRNGCNLIPTTTSLSNATKYEYAATANGYPFIYYNVTGGTHTPVLTINGTSSKNIIWDFLKTQTRMSQSDYDGRKRMEFNTGLDVAGFTPEAHGWKRNLNSQILWQYGEGSGYTSNIENKTGGYKEGKNVYHSLQFGSGWHNMQFTSSSQESNTSTIWVKVKLERLGKLSANADGSVFTPEIPEGSETPTPKVIFEDEYNIGEVSFNFNDKDLGGSAVGEYRLTFEWRCSSDTDPAIAKAIKITNASIVNGTHADYGVRHIETPESGFEGYIPYEKRLIAQWNFDLCDGARFNRQSLSTGWSADYAGKTDGIITYTYTQSLNNAQLTYGNSAKTLIPIFAGLKFTADPNKVKVQVYVDGGAMQRIQLVLEPGVQITVPYVKNTFRNNKDNNGNTQTQYEDYNDCLHHINRDILYVSSSPDFFDAVQNDVMPYTNKTDNWQNNFMFHTGGLEIVKGAKYRIPSMQKANYCGEQDGPCTITIKQTVTINRIGVNRNMVGSFYTEYISEYFKNQDRTITKPEPGLRYVASPYGSKVESEGYYGEYTKAIAMTFGGWTYKGNKYDIPVGDSGSKTMIDSWGDLNVYHGDGAEGNQNYNINKLDVTKVPLATDGFPVYSRMGDENFAYNENVNPTAIDDPFDKENLSYHDKNYGQFYLSTTDGGSYEYVENLTPWSLPCRGAFVKFEPTYPGVLNVHILQEANQTYYIADEFGKLVKTNIFTKTGTGQTVNNTNGHFSIGQKDNVKYTFDVYPGKSYYVFSNTASMGFTGFYFEPYVFMKNGTDEIERYDVGIKTATLRSEGYTGPSSLDWDDTMYTYTNQTSEQTERTYDPKNGAYTTADVPKSTIEQYITKNSGKKNYQPITYDNRAVHVTCDRQFTAGTWGTICLPYSMNHLQLEDVFGEGAKVVLMRDVQEAGKNGYNKTTINFIYHQNQDIIAGYPYLVYPTKNVDNVTSNAYLAETAPSIVSINGIGQNTVTHPHTNSDAVDDKDYYKTNESSYNYDGLPCFEFKGNFTPEDLGANSYVIATNGNLTRLAKTQTAAPYRAYVKYIGEPAQSGDAKLRIQAMNIGGVNGEDEDVVAIEDILLESGIVGAKTNVYSVNGTLIRQNTDDLRDLPKGVYIVNGKKYLVK